MTSKEAFERIKKSHYIAMSCIGIDKPDIKTENAINTIEKDLDRLEELEKYLKIIIKKRFNFDRFDYAIKYWETTKQQVDVYNSGIGNCYKLTEEEFESVKEVKRNEY